MSERGATRWWPLAVGALVALAAVAPPVDRWDARSLTAHMAQHVTLLVVAAPLLTAGRRPGSHARPLGAWFGLAALLAHLGAMASWHLPVAFDAAEGHDLLHGVEHVTLLATAAGFWWWAGVGSRPAPRPVVFGLFVASLGCTALGAAMTLAPAAWYAGHRSLSDQQVAGVVMWAFGGLVYIAAGAAAAVHALSGDNQPASSARSVGPLPAPVAR